MKKFFAVAIALIAFGAVSFAEDNKSVTDNTVILANENHTFELSVVSHLGVGWNIIATEDFTPSAPSSTEFFINALKFSVFPIENLGLELGIDYEFNKFANREKQFYIGAVDKKFYVADFLDADKRYSDVTIHSVNVPLLLKFRAGDFAIGVGAEGSWNFAGETYAMTKKANRRTIYEYTGGKINPLTYGFIASVTYDDFGVFGKYYPKSSKRILPENANFDLNFFTVGVTVGL